MKKTIGAVLIILMAAAASGQTLADNSEGRTRVAGNELIEESKVDDPAAIRLRAPATQGGSGKISFDAGTKEHTLLIGAQSPGQGGEFSLNLLRPGGSSTDADMVKVLEINHEGGFRFRLPVIFEAGSNAGGSSSPYPGCMGSGIPSDPQRWQMCQQGTDGNIVSYEIVRGNWCARWSMLHIEPPNYGRIPKSTSPIAACRE